MISTLTPFGTEIVTARCVEIPRRAKPPVLVAIKGNNRQEAPTSDASELSPPPSAGASTLSSTDTLTPPATPSTPRSPTMASQGAAHAPVPPYSSQSAGAVRKRSNGKNVYEDKTPLPEKYKVALEAAKAEYAEYADCLMPLRGASKSLPNILG